MNIGIGIFFLTIGAILAFAVDWNVGGLDLQTVGWIFMATGAGGLILFFYLWNRRRAPQAVAVLRQRAAADVSRTYDDPAPQPPTVTPMTSPQPPATVTTMVTPPPPVTTVTATAPVAVSSQGHPEAAER